MDIAVHLGEAEAALGAVLLLVGAGNYLGIDELDEAGAILGHIDDDGAADYSNLWRRKSETLGVIHGLGHVVQKLGKAGIKLFNRLAFF